MQHPSYGYTFSKERHLNVDPKGVKNGKNNTSEKKKTARKLLIFTPPLFNTHYLKCLCRTEGSACTRVNSPTVLCLLHHWHILSAQANLSALLLYTLAILLSCVVFSGWAPVTACTPAFSTDLPVLHTCLAQLLELPFPWSSLKFLHFHPEKMLSLCIWFHTEEKRDQHTLLLN